MADRRYKVYLNDIYFDSFYDADYYNDKPNFFAHGAKQFFTIYQILRNGDFKVTIVEDSLSKKFEFDNSAEFGNWVEQNYDYFADYLTAVYWDRHPESRLSLNF